MAHGSYEEQKKLVVKGLLVLGVITIVEVLIALLGNGHIIHGFELPKWVMYPLMISMSLYKAYFIVYFFMHMAYEVQGLRWSVLLPTLLLVWAIIAFFQEGNSWGASREKIKKKDQEEVEKAPANGHLDYDKETTKVLI